TESGLEGRLAPIVNDSVRGVLGDVSLADVLSTRRGQLMEQIRSQVNKQVQDATTDFGIVIVDLRIGRADLAPEVSESVYERMRAERQRDAADFRAQGEEIRQTIKGQADREATVIRAEATKQSSIARGEGDAERTRILNEAYGKDPSFFQFYRTMQAYRETLKGDTTKMVLSPDSEFMKYLMNAQPK
ncbi:MAG: protease modulator HflC, partial [Rickettsiales bacterium]|nr:protease modulator HflC [Rickettsiales bacterium]